MKKKILIAEDDLFIRDIAEKKLTDAGYEVYHTADGASVLKKIEEVRPDLLLLDLILPNVHGYALLQQIRNDTEFKDLKVVVFSNENGPDIEQKASELNAHYFFKAQTGTGELLDTINYLLQ